MLIRWLLGRAAQAAFVVWAAYTAAFLALYAIPSDPVEIMFVGAAGSGDTSPDPGAVDALRHEYGFDQPLPVQYFHSLANAVSGDFGKSVRSGTPVTTAILGALPNTVAVAVIALIAGTLLGLLLALAAASTQPGVLQRALDAVPGAVLSISGFTLALLILQVFSYTLHWFPAFGAQNPASMVLPAMTLAIPVAAVLAQVLVRALKTAMAAPYTAAVRAKGAGNVRILVLHALPNALPSGLALLGNLTGNLLGGAVVVEILYARNGLGQLAVDAVTNKDFPVVLGITVLSAGVFALTSLAVDILHPLFDPRLRTGHSHHG